MRLSEFDYSQNGEYFFTICTKDMKYYFGAIRNGIMGLNINGCLVWQQWYWLAKQYPYVILDEFIVMPNHVHGILIIDRPEVSPLSVGVPLAERNTHPLADGKSSLQAKNLLIDGQTSKQLDAYNIITSFKSRCSKEIHKAGANSFSWQKSFYEKIIDNEKMLTNIQNYIAFNPLMWKRDRNNHLILDT